MDQRQENLTATPDAAPAHDWQLAIRWNGAGIGI